MIALVLALLAPSTAYKLSEHAGVTPVQKVLEMMNEMLAKGKEEKAKEAALFEKYEAWCDKMKDDKETAIKDATDQINKAHAHKMKMDADATTLGDKVEDLDTEAALLTGDKKESTEVRTMEHEDYEHVHEDTTDNIDALGQAVKKLGEKAQDVFLQTGSKRMPQSTQQLVMQLMQENEQQPAQPEVKAFESSSGGILDTLGGLKGDLGEDREEMEVEESDERHGYNMQQDSLEGRIETDESRSDDKSVTKAQKQEESAHDGSDEAALTKQKEEDERYLAELVAQCEQKSTDFDARSEMRTEELAAVQQAIDIIASKSVAGSADKHLPSMLQRAGRSLALRASASMKTRAQAAANLLERAAARTHSKTLSRAVAAVQEAGHFDKVVQMIRDMIAQLTEQAGEEADHKAWCDEELKDNKNTRDSKTAEVSSLTAGKEKLEAQISSLTEQVSELSAAIAELDASMSEATSQRQKEHDQNTEAITDAKEAQAAVKTALGVLEGFYAKAAKATALAQGPASDAPESFNKPYTGMGQGKGVVGMLEVILSDFVRLEQETSSEEAEGKAAFEEFSSVSTEDKNAKTDSLKSKKHTILKQNHALAQNKKDLASTQTELDAAMQYFDKLKPDCLDAGVDFAERTQRREEEIASLKDALKILGDDA
jgi:hypothetical protein